VDHVRRALACAPRLLLWLLLALPRLAFAEEAATLAEQVQRYADAATSRLAQPAEGVRIEVEVGALDARVKLAPCARIEPYLPHGTRLWGRSHIGVRCAEGPRRWNVYLPVIVHVYGRALVAARALPAGTTLAAGDLVEAEVDLAAEREPAFAAAEATRLVGRSLARALDAREALRANQLKQRRWFAAGETVRIVAAGSGFAVATSGEALSPGVEGQSVRVRVEGGRILSGTPVGANRVEVRL
jgi:flagella basal body P-ring formation protein FlgA